MLRTRVIPVLLLKNNGLVKTIKFKKNQYIGDPINAIKIFNEKEVDELIFLDIEATKHNKEPNYEIIKSIASECFMPVCYGGGITTVEQIKKIFQLGIEKVSLNSSILNKTDLLKHAVEAFGSQSIVVSVDVKKNLFGKYCLYNHVRKKIEKVNLNEYLKKIEEMGAGEILLNNVDLDGTQLGYDVELIKYVINDLNVPMIYCGGAKDLSDFKVAKELKVSGVAAGSMFVFHGKHKAVLITYPAYKKLKILFEES
ncbi:MAG: imidazole glycerol phosphate synthase subunit HisF [Arcobacter sp.]|uniref:AglZ/HisF2 family acetamidino modification protein n=1 Tax=uncultured Arcobacter sp. TaxID=165434 RepID=UPI000CC75759|nr:AglZ/HisF2 family acetamidino modification protein [uncultured Arcobacter sp.]PLY10472.1 MAG: imidazole glycerol phosphate synthase subunit HisF [Arcobacter sp.]